MNASKTLPEVCLNLWWYLDESSQLVYRLAGRAYALEGTEETKCRILQQLAATDFYTAPTFPVPEHFAVHRSSGDIQGAAPPASVSLMRAELFDHVFRALEKKLPTQVRFSGDEPEFFRLSIPDNPLSVITCIKEYPDGRFIPVLQSHPPATRTDI